MLKKLSPTTRIVLGYLFGLFCLIFPFYILDHEWMQELIEKIDRSKGRFGSYDLYAVVVYGVLWYVPLIIGTCLISFLSIGLLYLYFIKRSKK